MKTQQVASLEEILVGPAHENDGTFNLFGALAHVAWPRPATRT